MHERTDEPNRRNDSPTGQRPADPTTHQAADPPNEAFWEPPKSPSSPNRGTNAPSLPRISAVAAHSQISGATRVPDDEQTSGSPQSEARGANHDLHYFLTCAVEARCRERSHVDAVLRQTTSFSPRVNRVVLKSQLVDSLGLSLTSHAASSTCTARLVKSGLQKRIPDWHGPHTSSSNISCCPAFANSEVRLLIQRKGCRRQVASAPAAPHPFNEPTRRASRLRTVSRGGPLDHIVQTPLPKEPMASIESPRLYVAPGWSSSTARLAM